MVKVTYEYPASLSSRFTPVQKGVLIWSFKAVASHNCLVRRVQIRCWVLIIVSTTVGNSIKGQAKSLPFWTSWCQVNLITPKLSNHLLHCPLSPFTQPEAHRFSQKCTMRPASHIKPFARSGSSELSNGSTTLPATSKILSHSRASSTRIRDSILKMLSYCYRKIGTLVAGMCFLWVENARRVVKRSFSATALKMNVVEPRNLEKPTDQQKQMQA